MEENYFESHCDNEDCSMGRFYYKCPNCLRCTHDYGDVYADRFYLYEGKILYIRCNSCETNLEVKMEKGDILVREPKKPFEKLKCVNNGKNYDLTKEKVYDRIEDAVSEGFGCVRVIDDSGLDYVYPKYLFSQPQV